MSFFILARKSEIPDRKVRIRNISLTHFVYITLIAIRLSNSATRLFGTAGGGRTKRISRQIPKHWGNLCCWTADKLLQTKSYNLILNNSFCLSMWVCMCYMCTQYRKAVSGGWKIVAIPVAATRKWCCYYVLWILNWIHTRPLRTSEKNDRRM